MSKINSMKLPKCMLPDGAPPCDPYHQLYCHAIALEELLHECASKLESQIVRNKDLPKSYNELIEKSYALLNKDDNQHKHLWVSADNEVVSGGLICTICNSVKAT